MKFWSAALLAPVLAHAGVSYDMSVRALDQPGAVPVVTPYFVQDGKVRIGAGAAKKNYLFKDGTIFIIDNPSHGVTVLRHATLAQAAVHYADILKQFQQSAAAAPPEERAAAEKKAADMQEASDRLLRPVDREYRVTVRSESVGGRDCRIWEEQEDNAKRLEVCVASGTLPGSAEILNGLKTLSQFRQGSILALGVDFGLSEWWRDVASFNGVPLLIREFKYEQPVMETTLTNIRTGISPRCSYWKHRTAINCMMARSIRSGMYGRKLGQRQRSVIGYRQAFTCVSSTGAAEATSDRAPGSGARCRAPSCPRAADSARWPAAPTPT